MGHRKRWYTISGVLLLICLASMLFRGLNLGIEFQGGTVFTVPVTVTSSTPNELGRVVEDTGLSELDGTSVVTIGDHSARVQTRTMTPEEVVTVRTALAQFVGVSVDDVAYSTVGASWGQQITERGIQALVVFLVLVALMIWAYFRDWKMSVAALVALVHDLVLTIGIYSVLGLTVSPASLIGVLTILGYSLYDTVVVFDKVRENVKDITKQKHTYSEQANLAVNQVLVRSINTTVIGVLPVAAILVAATFFMGPGPLEDLGLALFVGMIAGAYSSIFIAAPLLAQLREREPEMVKHREKLGRRTARHARGSMQSVAEVADSAEQDEDDAAKGTRGGPEVILNEVGEDPWELEGVEVEGIEVDDLDGPEDDRAEVAATRRQPRRQSRGRRRN
ncbi:protein translocase subunit SecF [Aestuariimicrobium sp. Y1814]|uniref:protein translocase subunit SecF n=1 Tax=Aestuariimicrobium sp. Y1814 TaxID=3418742 RepID=UPI003DA72883